MDELVYTPHQFSDLQDTEELARIPIIFVTGATAATGVDVESGRTRPKESYGDEMVTATSYVRSPLGRSSTASTSGKASSGSGSGPSGSSSIHHPDPRLLL